MKTAIVLFMILLTPLFLLADPGEALGYKEDKIVSDDIIVDVIEPELPPVITEDSVDICPPNTNHTIEIAEVRRIVSMTPAVAVVEPPNEFTTLEGDIGHFFLYGPMITAQPFVDALRFFVDLDIKRMVIEIHTPGGSIFAMQRIVGYMDSYRDRITFETRVYGVAMSAGLIIFLAGDERYMSRNMAFILWHNPEIGGNPYKDPPPEQVQMLKSFKDMGDGYVASRSGKITINRVRLEIEDNIWMIFAEEAIELGLATGYIEDQD